MNEAVKELTPPETMVPPEQAGTKLSRIEERLNPAAVGQTLVSSVAGIQFRTMLEVMEFSKLMSIAGEAVPKHCQGNPGMCLAICIQAMEWKSSPFAVANKSYVVNNRLSFESQLVHAIIEQRAPIQGRIRHEFEGDGPTRTCTVWALPKGEAEPLSYTSPPFEQIKPKNSPLWATKPDLQLYYNTVRDFARAYFPDVLLGIYSKDELEDAEPMAAEPASPNLMERLPGRIEGPGFSHDAVTNGLEEKRDAAAVEKAEEIKETKKAEKKTKPKTEKEPPKQPTTAIEYIAFAEAWIEKEKDPETIKARWDGERDMRDELSVKLADRKKLEKQIAEKIGE